MRWDIGALQRSLARQPEQSRRRLIRIRKGASTPHFVRFGVSEGRVATRFYPPSLNASRLTP